MKNHNGMRPQDIVVLLKIIIKGKDSWQNKDLANQLFISQAEISASLDRSLMGGLINFDKKRVHKQTLWEFIEYGLHVVFPVKPGGITTGMFTAHSHPYMQQYFTSNEQYVWSDLDSNGRGQSILPLYKNAVKAAQADITLYKMLALIDVIRVGKARELKIALEELRKMTYEPSH